MTYRPVNLGPQEISSDPPVVSDGVIRRSGTLVLPNEDGLYTTGDAPGVPYALPPATQVDWPKTHSDEFWAYMIEQHRSHDDWWKGPDDCHHPACKALMGWYRRLEARR